METNLDFGSLTIIGIGVTLLVQFLKNKLNLSEYGTLAIVLAISLIAATGYFFATKTFLEALYVILAIAGSVYTYVIARFEK